MVSVVLSSLVCVLCVILLPAVWADYCEGYWDTSGYYHDTKDCGVKYCCANCNNKYCCSKKIYHLIQKNQERCPERFSYEKHSNPALLPIIIIGSIFPVILCVALIICCVAPCCLFYKKCRKGRNQNRTHTPRVVMPTTTQVNTPQPQFLPSEYQPSYPGYQSVPQQPGYGGPPVPTAPPPPYLEAEGGFTHTQPTNSFQLHPYTPPTHSDELAQPPYNPSYGLNPLTGYLAR